MRISLEINSMRLGEWAAGRRTLFVCLYLGRRRFWLQWWDTGRSSRRPILTSRDKFMALTAGR